MTRINTNISALSAQKSLAKSQASLQSALTRLSTGLRINTGKDDPAGLIASEILRSDITSVGRAISNSERANQVIATADSALGQVSALLNDIRGLVTEAANEGALSAEQISANQLQIDSSLEAINRIAQSTTFQGRKLLDGSLDFQTTAGVFFTDITDLEITQANLGASDSMSVDIRVIDAAEKAEIKMTGSTDTTAQDVLTLGMGLDYENAATGTTMTIYNDATSTITGINFVDGGGAAPTSVQLDGTNIEITTKTAGDTVANVFAAINTASGLGSWGVTASDDGGAGDFVTANEGLGVKAFAAETLTIDAVDAGPAYNNMDISFTTHAGGATAAATWTDLTDRSTLVISLQAAAEVVLTDVTTAIANAVDAVGKFTGTLGSVAGSRASVNSANAVDVAVTGDTEGSGGSVLVADLVVQLTGETGSEFLNLGAGTQMAHIAAAVNAISETLGMTASVADGSGTDASGTLVLTSSNYGSSALINVDVISEGVNGAFENSLTAVRDTGTDIDATVNGSSTLGSGNTLSLSTAMLDLEATIGAGVEKTISFTIDSGGALFQLGPDVVATQQARLGIQSVNAAQLRGVSGRLYELGSGQAASLTADTTTAARIVEEVITKVTSLRGRLGAFQKTTLDPNIATLNDTMVNLTEAQSSIRDADFASETAALTRSQILVQSGISVVAIANSNPQNVLALLR